MFDGIHTYNICDWVQGKKPDQLRALSAHASADAVQLARTHGRISCLTVISGYDDTKSPQGRFTRINRPSKGLASASAR